MARPNDRALIAATIAMMPNALGALTLAALTVLTLGIACSPASPSIVQTPIPVAPPPAEPLQPATPAEPKGPLGVDEGALDKSVDPCDDFYAYACGGWMKSTPIPEDRPAWTRSFNEIDERNDKALRAILDDYAGGKNASDPYAQKLADFWSTCMDEEGVERAGLKPLAPAFSIIDGMKDPSELARVVKELYALGLHPLFGFSSGQDFKDATQVIGQLEQGGLGLPDRDYYLDKDDKGAKIRAAYEAHVAKMLELSKLDPAAAKAIVALETELAKGSMTRVDRRDPKKIYHKMTLAELGKLSPKFLWSDFAQGLVAKDAPINVAQPEFVKTVGRVATKAKIEDLRVYLKWQVVGERAPSLPKAFVDEDFRFKSENLTGSKTLLPRWKRCVKATDAALGEALAQRFVKDHFGAEGKAKALSMIGEIEEAMQKDLDGLAWMDEPTRKRALEKLHKIKNKIGYPDAWRNYDTLTVGRQAHATNVLSAQAFETRRMLAKIGKPLDRGEWWMTPPTVNAYYDANMNEMVFPAGILQPPFFDKAMADAVNYGAIGMVMGHELTHGFDDEGRQFDGDGNLSEWWTSKVNKEFDKRAACVVKQFDGYTALEGDAGKPDVKVNGKLTLGENIADLGGVKLAYAAFESTHKDAPAIGGFSPDQQFFIGYAQGWCQNARPQYRAMLAKVDPHSPSRWRVNGPISNTAEFATAFSCKAGSKMVRPPADRCEVW